MSEIRCTCTCEYVTMLDVVIFPQPRRVGGGRNAYTSNERKAFRRTKSVQGSNLLARSIREISHWSELMHACAICEWLNGCPYLISSCSIGTGRFYRTDSTEWLGMSFDRNTLNSPPCARSKYSWLWMFRTWTSSGQEHGDLWKD
jgi:hypothetical protein